MRNAWKSSRCGYLEPHGRGLGQLGTQRLRGAKQEVEVETKGWAPSFSPALFVIQSPAKSEQSSQGVGAFVTFCALHHQPLTTDSSLEVKYVSFGAGSPV